LLHADFLGDAENSKLPLVSFSSTAKGKLEKVEGIGYQITEIVIKPRVVIKSAHDLARMPKILEKAKQDCFISNSIRASVKLEPEVFHHQTQASPCPWGEPLASGSSASEQKTE
jgi:OsmC-like protein